MTNIKKRLLIQASNDYNQKMQVVPVNSGKGIEIESALGKFILEVYIKGFDPSAPHKENSLYNKEEALDAKEEDETSKTKIPNLRLNVFFEPSRQIKGSELIFGNDFNAPIKDYIPTSLLSAGLKFFSYFINNTIKGDIYSDKPYLYGLALNSFTKIRIEQKGIEGEKEPSNNKTPINLSENLNENEDNTLQIPSTSTSGKQFFSKGKNCENFIFNTGTTYLLQFDTNFLLLADSKYFVSLPMWGNRTFDIDVLKYANENLDNVNWIIKQGGMDAVGSGTPGLILNFALVEEEF